MTSIKTHVRKTWSRNQSATIYNQAVLASRPDQLAPTDVRNSTIRPTGRPPCASIGPASSSGGTG
jgi:hypothetical protein